MKYRNEIKIDEVSNSSLLFQVYEIFCILVLVGSFGIRIGESKNVQVLKPNSKLEYSALNCRKHSGFLTDYGGVGDGKTLNTKAFQSAIANLSQYASDGGAELIVTSGRWLTGSFNLTSHFTLFIHRSAVILASQVLIHFFLMFYEHILDVIRSHVHAE